MFSRLVETRTLLAGCFVAMSVLTFLLNDTALGRLYRLAVGLLAAALVVMAASLWLRTARGGWFKILPMKWLQKNHVLVGCLSAGLTVCHMGGVFWPRSAWSCALTAFFSLTIATGVVTWFFKKLRPTATFADQTIKVKPGPSGAQPARTPRQEDALKGSQTIVETQDQQLEAHRGLTVALLVLLVGHIAHRLFY
jgi:hypothetical protein